MLNEKYYIRDFLVQFLLLLIRPIDWIGCSIILESKHPGRRIGSTFNGQYLGAGLLIPSILNWIGSLGGRRQACIPLIMKVIVLHRTTPAITRLNGICVQRAKREQREELFKTYFGKLNFFSNLDIFLVNLFCDLLSIYFVSIFEMGPCLPETVRSIITKKLGNYLSR